MQRELQILSPDGQTRALPLEGDRISLGRSSNAELCYPDDSGLSRHHLAIEREGPEWILRDLGSKNGTMLNGARINDRAVLRPGDRISAGHLVLVYGPSAERAPRPVVFFENNADDDTASSTVISNLQSVLKNQTKAQEPMVASAHVNALIRAGNELAGQRPLPELFRFILDLSIQAVNADRGVLMTIEDGELVVRAAKGEGFHISGAVRDRVLKTHASVMVRDTRLDDALRERRSIVEQNIRTLMAVPLQTSDRIIGLIYVDSPSFVREFSKDDLSLLTVMANVAAIRIENARLAEMEQARILMARDLEQAADIQRRFLPAAAPTLSGLDLAGHNAPCRTVGGDYYDFFAYPSGRVAVVLGDVSGKGMPASLLMMSLQARVQMLIDEPDDLAAVMTRLNRLTCTNCPANKFVSFFLCLLNSQTGEILYANAGHNPPLIVRENGSFEVLDGGGPVLGIMPAVKYEQFRAQLQPGDLLSIYSDGVTEAMNKEEEELDVERFTEVLRANRDQAAGALVASVNQALVEWCGGAPQHDDITLIVAKRTGGASAPLTAEAGSDILNQTLDILDPPPGAVKTLGSAG